MTSRARRYAIVALLCLAAFALAVDSMRRESVTVDEPLHLVSGYAFWKFGDYRLQDTNGVLPQRWEALPLLAMPVQFPSRDAPDWRHPGYLAESLCWKFLYQVGNDPDVMVLAARLMALVFGLALIVAVYAWTSRILGRAAGLLAAFFCALSPTVLAHGHLLTEDVPAALLFLMCAGCFWLLLRRITLVRLAASAGCFGLLLVTKMSAPLFVVMAAAMAAVRLALGRPWPVRLPGLRARDLRTGGARAGALAGVVLIHALGAWLVIWTFFGWRFVPPAAEWNPAVDSYTENFSAVLAPMGAARPVLAAMERWRLLPESYIFGLAHTLKHAAERHAYINGRYSTTGWWYYFPYAFLVKTALPLLACAALGFGYLVWRAVRERRRRGLLAWLDRTSPFWAVALVYGITLVLSRLNIGQRHLLPVYPAVFALGGLGAWWLMRRGRWGVGIGVALLLFQVATVARTHPYYLSYFNVLGGGEAHGYRHLTDSNVDWGQDLPALAVWLGEHPAGPGERTYVNLFGYDTPKRWGISSYELPYDVTNPRLSSADPIAFEPGLYCISATTLILPGPAWTPQREVNYRSLLSEFGQLEQAHPAGSGDPDARKAWSDFIFKLAYNQYWRLRGYLFNRRPDAIVGGSILIYHLSGEELQRALLPSKRTL